MLRNITSSGTTRQIIVGSFRQQQQQSVRSYCTENGEEAPATVDHAAINAQLRQEAIDRLNSLSLVDSLKTTRTKIISMPFEYSYQSFYKNKRTTKKGFINNRTHLKAFGAVPYIFPESMFREIRPAIPLSEVNKNSNVTKQEQSSQSKQE
eukprot:gene18597-22251_t